MVSRVITKVALLSAAGFVLSSISYAEQARVYNQQGSVELVDGLLVEGQVVMEWDGLVIMRSQKFQPQSFRMNEVHAITLGDSRREVNPKRELTDVEIEQRSPVIWGDEYYKDNYFTPDFVTEPWEEARLLIWAKPGQDGDWLEAGNYIDQEGNPAQSPPDMETDVLVPHADQEYVVQSVSPDPVRHVTVESNARLTGKHRNELEVWGNVWRKPGSESWGWSVRGPRDVVWRLDKGVYPNYEKGICRKPVDGMRHTNTNVSHKFQICKYAGDSVEFIGNWGVTDEIMLQCGKMIVNGEWRWSGGTSKGALEIFDGATLEIQSGSRVAPFDGYNKKAVYNIDVYRNGTIQAGSPERPLVDDASIMLGFEEYDEPGRTGLYSAQGSMIKVYTTDPEKHKLIITSITSDPEFYNGQGDVKHGDPDTPAEGNKGVVVQLAGNLEFDGVEFDYIAEEGIKLADPAAKEEWKNVSFGDKNAALPEGLFGPMTAEADSYYVSGPRGDDEYKLTRAAQTNLLAFLEEYDQYKIASDPPAVEYRDEGGQKEKPLEIIYDDRVQVELTSALRDADIYYTTDGTDPSEDSFLYDGPILLNSTTTIKARAFLDGNDPSPVFQTTYVVK